MIIGIVTLPPKHNYGGILQAYAIQEYIRQLGHEVEQLDIHREVKPTSFWYKCGSFVKRFILKYLLFRKNVLSPFNQRRMSVEEHDILYKHTTRFVKENIRFSDWLKPCDTKALEKYEADAFVVGSDQVWRPKYASYLPHYYLDFCANKPIIKRVAYAASFGVDESEYTSEQVKVCRPLAQKFDAISVREESGIKLCKELFDVPAVHVIDPTMLLSAEHYKELASKHSKPGQGNLFNYILDKSPEKSQIIEKVASAKSLKAFGIMPKDFLIESDNIEECIMPPVEQWLQSFVDAEFVVTDSFHGCVFSIIFKKDFIAIGNPKRGMARFKSLLKMFDLEDRLILSLDQLSDELINRKIDFERVHGILHKEQEKAKGFLETAFTK